MSKKTLHSLNDLQVVFSTHSSNIPSIDENNVEISVDKNQMVIRIQLNTKLKGGKSATIIKGLEESAEELDQLCRKIKQKCGVGGSVKENEIIIQGDQVNKLVLYLKELGYKNTKRTGG